MGTPYQPGLQAATWLGTCRDDGVWGRIFIRRATYTVDPGHRVRPDFTEVRSDYARLAFGDHEPSGSAQVDFAVSEARHVEVNGLVLDGQKRERTGGTGRPTSGTSRLP